jgi:XRE family aerobic/anaerobic benzoate catabolism transcriptional regulator
VTEITNFRGETRPACDPEVGAQVLIARVGERVRKLRQQRGIPRRVLSEKSGVSPRYLAQLETGAGNISIALLERVAQALDFRIEWLVGEDDPWTSDALQVAELYRRADGDLRRAVQRLLQPDEPQSRRAQRICLLGLRGAGKSTLGRLAGQALDLPFLELNREIEDHSGMPVAEVMALYGQEGYRMLEAQALDRVIETHDSVILAVAGGIVADPTTFTALLAGFHTVWLRATAEDHMARVRAQDDLRPMRGNPEAMAQLKTLLDAREALYARAGAQIDTAGKTVETSLAELLAVIAEHRFLG